MSTIFFAFVLISIIAGMEGRTIVSSSLNEAIPGGSTRHELSRGFSVSEDIEYPKNLTKINVDIGDTTIDSVEARKFIAAQNLNLEEILSEFAAKTVDFKDYEERAAQWLRLLKQMLRSLSIGTEMKKSASTETTFDDEIDEIDTILIDGDKKKFPIDGYSWLGDFLEFLDEQEIDEQSSDEDERHVKSRYEDSSTSFSLIHENSEVRKNDEKSEHQDPEKFDNMLVGVQNEIDRIREYFAKLCSKHHSMSVMTPTLEDHNHIVRPKNSSRFQ